MKRACLHRSQNAYINALLVRINSVQCDTKNWKRAQFESQIHGNPADVPKKIHERERESLAQ